jgi:hypothetical protein
VKILSGGKKRITEIFLSIILALNAMQTSLDNIGNNPKTVQVIALISSPIIYQTLVRIID